MHSSWIKSLLVIALLFAVLTLSNCGSSPTISHSPHGLVVVTPATATVLRGQSQQFVAQVSGATDQTVSWQTTNVSGATGTIDSTGLYTAPSSGADGFLVTITATSKAPSGGNGTAQVTLPSVSLSIAPDAILVLPGRTQAFTASVAGLADTSVNWTIQGTAGGTVTSAGVYTAPSTAGVYNVVATSAVDANYSATAPVLVTAAPSPFSAAGQLMNDRVFHTATLLTNGRVLVAGGGVEQDEYSCLGGIASAEVYDPTLGSFALTSSMTDLRYAQTSTLLPNGKVLIAGGFSFNTSTCLNQETSPPLMSAELYDPSTGSFTLTGNMSQARGSHTATLLATGKVLIVGGGDSSEGDPPFDGNGSATAEVYDPSVGTFTSTGNMSTARIGQTSTLLPNGKVLITGGITSSSRFQALATAELYDPLTRAFTVVGAMSTARVGHTATLLPNGTVLITGGFADAPGGFFSSTLTGTNSAEIYDPVTGSFQATNQPMEVERWGHTATLLPNGTILLVGGGPLLAEIYNPSNGSFLPVGFSDFDRTGDTATLLKNGSVIFVGGWGSLMTAELYQ